MCGNLARNQEYKKNTLIFVIILFVFMMFIESRRHVNMAKKQRVQFVTQIFFLLLFHIHYIYFLFCKRRRVPYLFGSLFLIPLLILSTTCTMLLKGNNQFSFVKTRIILRV